MGVFLFDIGGVLDKWPYFKEDYYKDLWVSPHEFDHFFVEVFSAPLLGIKFGVEIIPIIQII